MAVFKCKMCGGTIEFKPGDTVGVCDSCGTKQTLASIINEDAAGMHDRANVLRKKCEFDKAEDIYNKILEIAPNDAEAHWGIILCKYGVEFVVDQEIGESTPTCHRTSYDAILSDEDYKAAIENASGEQREKYEKEAREIDQIQRKILSIVRNEKPFDVFICYKEDDEDGKRTKDSVIANDIYYQLTQEGFNVFYAAVTLEDKLGQEYEPYIFAALSSARVMLVVGTKPEHFSSVWVKNEWSRFLKLMKTDRSKLLIPCYKDMNPYDLPDEFAHLQAQDMGKIGFINDLVRGVKKVVGTQPHRQEEVRKPNVAPSKISVGVPTAKQAMTFLTTGSLGSSDDQTRLLEAKLLNMLNALGWALIIVGIVIYPVGIVTVPLGIILLVRLSKIKKGSVSASRSNSNSFANMIKFPKTISNYKSKTFYTVEDILKSAGFTSVKCIPLNDLKIGLVKKPGFVESITINGSEIKAGGKKYLPDAPIVVSYHSFSGARIEK